MASAERARRGSVEAVLNCEWCLDKYNHQGWYGECFVQVLAAAAGLQASPLTPDCTGVDFYLCLPREIDGDFPRIEVQVKTWSKPDRRNGYYHYRGLTEKRFNALAGRRRIPRYLFLVVVPHDTGAFAEVDEHALRLSHAAYWVSLEDEQRITTPQCKRKVEVRVPESNLLTADALLKLFDPLRTVEAP
ncbi:DUF4365 domain-containing protein [Microbispora sp. NBC_01189]|uniref:DUF4365 domain-containing protein n=1 Tax=Microbispora sp. NBC_01189 TaxID=2903583 RepID=UPI002E14AC6E|nr:DUF4365 domain-containing protein [Microbispora sp. NBC_01189]